MQEIHVVLNRMKADRERIDTAIQHLEAIVALTDEPKVAIVPASYGRDTKAGGKPTVSGAARRYLREHAGGFTVKELAKRITMYGVNGPRRKREKAINAALLQDAAQGRANKDAEGRWHLINA